jgi:hypothetical protein
MSRLTKYDDIGVLFMPNVLLSFCMTNLSISASVWAKLKKAVHYHPMMAN